MIERPDFVSTFFKAYDEFQQTPYTKRVLDCLVQVVAIRKGLFSGEDERNRFLSSVMRGIRDIILSLRHMEDEDCYQGFCRLIQRFRIVVPLNDLADRPDYAEWIDLVAGFTQNALGAGHCFHLLKFWSKIVEDMTHFQQLGESKVKKMQEITTELVKTFIAIRIASDDDEEIDEESLRMLGQIARCRYEKSCAVLMDIFDPVAAEYQVFISQASMAGVLDGNIKAAIELYETKFAWFIYLMAVFVGNRPVNFFFFFGFSLYD